VEAAVDSTPSPSSPSSESSLSSSSSDDSLSQGSTTLVGKRRRSDVQVAITKRNGKKKHETIVINDMMWMVTNKVIDKLEEIYNVKEDKSHTHSGPVSLESKMPLPGLEYDPLPVDQNHLLEDEEDKLLPTTSTKCSVNQWDAHYHTHSKLAPLLPSHFLTEHHQSYPIHT